MEVLVTVNGRETFKIDLPKGYFGLVQLQFVNEEMILIRKEQSEKPEKLKTDFVALAG